MYEHVFAFNWHAFMVIVTAMMSYNVFYISLYVCKYVYKYANTQHLILIYNVYSLVHGQLHTLRKGVPLSLLREDG